MAGLQSVILVGYHLNKLHTKIHFHFLFISLFSLDLLTLRDRKPYWRVLKEDELQGSVGGATSQEDRRVACEREEDGLVQTQKLQHQLGSEVAINNDSWRGRRVINDARDCLKDASVQVDKWAIPAGASAELIKVEVTVAPFDQIVLLCIREQMQVRRRVKTKCRWRVLIHNTKSPVLTQTA